MDVYAHRHCRISDVCVCVCVCWCAGTLWGSARSTSTFLCNSSPHGRNGRGVREGWTEMDRSKETGRAGKGEGGGERRGGRRRGAGVGVGVMKRKCREGIIRGSDCRGLQGASALQHTRHTQQRAADTLHLQACSMHVTLASYRKCAVYMV